MLGLLGQIDTIIHEMGNKLLTVLDKQNCPVREKGANRDNRSKLFDNSPTKSEIPFIARMRNRLFIFLG